ncbi:MAG TPA: helix-turn-helix domain-containing protein [Pseudonocardiaceae bacterium]
MAPSTEESAAQHDQTKPDSWWREQLSNRYGLFVVSMMMFDNRDADDIVRLAATSVPWLSGCEVEAVYVIVDGVLTPNRGGGTPSAELDEQVGGLAGDNGSIDLSDGVWRWAFTLRGLSGPNGFLVVRARGAPSQDEFFLVEALGQQLACALANAELHRHEREQAGRLKRLNAELSASVTRLQQQTSVHEVLSSMSASCTGEPGIAHALHQLTGLPVAIEDRFGNLRAWSGPGPPEPYPKPSRRQREEVLRRAAAIPHPVRVKDRLVSLVKPRHEVLGVLALVDPGGAAGGHEMFALEYGTTVLALELSHQRNLAEIELRLHRDFVDDLIAGTDDESAYARADAIGHDLRGRHHVVVLRWRCRQTDDDVAEAAGRTATALRLNSLVSRRSEAVVLLVHGRPDGHALHRALSETLGTPTGAIGIGGHCDGPADFPQSYSEAMRALNIRQKSLTPNGVTSFEQLGVYRILDTGQNHAEVWAFVQEWLGPLLDYDRTKNSELVRTLSLYLECGGNYDETAAALMIHRSTLRYRLGRIKEIADLDLNDVDSRLNLHVAARAWQVLSGLE